MQEVWDNALADVAEFVAVAEEVRSRLDHRRDVPATAGRAAAVVAVAAPSQMPSKLHGHRCDESLEVLAHYGQKVLVLANSHCSFDSWRLPSLL